MVCSVDEVSVQRMEEGRKEGQKFHLLEKLCLLVPAWNSKHNVAVYMACSYCYSRHWKESV